jgi:hypothetical protein
MNKDEWSKRAAGEDWEKRFVRIPDDAREDAVLSYLLTLKIGDRVKDIEHPKLGHGVVAGHMDNGFPLILWSNIVEPCAAGLGTRPSDANDKHEPRAVASRAPCSCSQSGSGDK